MTRWIAVLALFLVAFAVVVPALAPAPAWAAVDDPATAGFPPVPWSQVWNLVKSWGPMIIYLIDALITALNNGGDPGGPPNPPPPPPPPSDPVIQPEPLRSTTAFTWRPVVCAAGAGASVAA